MKKVLILHSSLGLGGAEKMIAFLADTLSAVYEVELLLLRKNVWTVDVPESVKVAYQPCWAEKPIVSKYILSGMRKLADMRRRIKQEIKIFLPDLVICFEPRILEVLYTIPMKQNVKVLFSERTDPLAVKPYQHAIFVHIYKKIDYIVFQTDGARECYGGPIKKKSCVIANPAIPRNAAPCVNLYEHGKDYIFAAGRFQRRKGFDLLVRAYKMIAGKTDADLVIFGEGEERDAIMRMIHAYHLSGRIKIEPPKNDIIEANKNALLFVMPSRSEGIPNILIEAMYANIPCVASDCSPGGAKLVSSDGEYCLLAKNDDPHDLAKKILYALNHKKYMEEMARKARKGLVRFSPSMIQKQWLDAIASLI